MLSSTAILKSSSRPSIKQLNLARIVRESTKQSNLASIFRDNVSKKHKADVAGSTKDVFLVGLAEVVFPTKKELLNTYLHGNVTAEASQPTIPMTCRTPKVKNPAVHKARLRRSRQTRGRRARNLRRVMARIA